MSFLDYRLKGAGNLSRLFTYEIPSLKTGTEEKQQIVPIRAILGQYSLRTFLVASGCMLETLLESQQAGVGRRQRMRMDASGFLAVAEAGHLPPHELIEQGHGELGVAVFRTVEHAFFDKGAAQSGDLFHRLA